MRMRNQKMPPPPAGNLSRGGPKRRRASGFTLVELALAMTLLLVALMAMSASTVRMHELRRQNRERNMAQNAMRSVAERIHSLSAISVEGQGDTPWSEILATAMATGGSIGVTFDVPELDPPNGNATVGTITLVLDETVTDADLGYQLGMPRDLDADGLADNADVRSSARILPVVLDATWRGATGVVTLRHAFYVMGY